jgi:hypothetical protein
MRQGFSFAVSKCRGGYEASAKIGLLLLRRLKRCPKKLKDVLDKAIYVRFTPIYVVVNRIFCC